VDNRAAEYSLFTEGGTGFSMTGSKGEKQK